jgi:hypothetical protein
VSGAGPRPFDADQRLVVPLYQLDVARPFEQWTVLGRTEGSDGRLALADLGLAAATDYLAFEFWTRTTLGTVRDQLALPPVDPAYQVQVVCLRPRLAHPQVLATNRHVTCGGPDLLDVRWADGTLSARVDLAAGDEYAIYLTEPQGFTLQDVQAEGANVIGHALEGATRIVRLRSATGGPATWSAVYARAR